VVVSSVEETELYKWFHNGSWGFTMAPQGSLFSMPQTNFNTMCSQQQQFTILQIGYAIFCVNFLFTATKHSPWPPLPLLLEEFHNE
jgi:hypothetical protein